MPINDICSICNDYVENCLMNFYKEKNEIPIIKDSKEEFDSFEEITLENKNDAIYASEQYYRFEAPESIQNIKLNFNNPLI